MLGGYGGRKYALEKRRGEEEGGERERGGSRRRKKGWDEKCRMGRKGAGVR